MKKRKLVILFLFILIIPGTLAIGISPGKSVTNFKPELEKDFSYKISNTVNKSIKATITLEGKSKEYITPEEEEIFIDALGSKSIHLKLKLPKEMPSGENKLMFKISAEPLTTYSATTALRTYIKVIVPYPNAHLQTRLSVEDTQVGNKVPIKITVKNKGTKSANDLNSEIIISGTNTHETIPLAFEKMEPIKTESKSVKWNSEHKSAGNYSAKLSFTYGNKTTSDEAKFKIGEKSVRIKKITAESMKKGARSKVDVLIASEWNSPIDDVFTEVEIGDQLIKSKTDVIPKNGEKEFSVYVETSELKEGTNIGTATVFYPIKSDQEKFKLIVKKSPFSKLFTKPMSYFLLTSLIMVFTLLIIKYIKNKKKPQYKNMYGYYK